MFIILRYDSERAITKLGETATKKDAWKLLTKDFEQWFNEKYGYEMEHENIDFQTMYEKANETCECKLNEYESTAYLNDCNDYDFDWCVIELEIPEEVKAAIRNGQL